MRLKTIFFCGELAEKQKFMREQIFLGYKEAEKKNFLKAAIFLGQIFWGNVCSSVNFTEGFGGKRAFIWLFTI